MAAAALSGVVVWTGAEGAVVDMSFVFPTTVVFVVFCITGVNFSVPGWPFIIALSVGAGIVGIVFGNMVVALVVDCTCVVSWFVC